MRFLKTDNLLKTEKKLINGYILLIGLLLVKVELLVYALSRPAEHFRTLPRGQSRNKRQPFKGQMRAKRSAVNGEVATIKRLTA